MALVYVLADLDSLDRQAHKRVLDSAPDAIRRDLKGIERWYSDHSGWVRSFAMASNDVYLRANGGDDGVGSYTRMTDLVIAYRRSALAGGH